MNISQFIENHYELAQLGFKGEKFKILVYKPRVMNSLPEELLDYFYDMYGPETVGAKSASKDGMSGNCDYGLFDAFYTMYYQKSTSTLSIYVNSILRHPFTEKQQREHNKSAKLFGSDRIRYIYDSANDSQTFTPILKFRCSRCGGVYKATSLDFAGNGDNRFDLNLLAYIKESIDNGEGLEIGYRAEPACTCIFSPIKIKTRQ